MRIGTKKNGASMDMLHGPMLKNILLFALPLALGSILQQMFNAVDVAVVGRFASSEALAAVGANSPVVSLLINLFVGVSVGSNVVIANHIGRGAKDNLRNAVHTSVLLSVISGVVLLVVGMVIAKPLLLLMSTPEEVLQQAILYLRLYCIGMPFIMLYNFGAAILRSNGDTKRPLYCLIVSGVINALLNMFFVIVMHMSVAGVAIATVISNVVSAALVLYYLQHADEQIRLDLHLLRLDRSELVRILKIGVPAGIQGVVFSVANVCIQASVNSFGSAAIAGSSVILNFEYIDYFAVNGFNAAVMTFMSQNLGANKLNRCKRAYLLGMCSAVTTSLILTFVIFLFRYPLIGIFTRDADVVHYAIERMIYAVLPHVLICTYEITGSALRGLGKSMVPAFLTVFGTCALRLIYINTVVPRHHTFGILMAVYPISWIVTGTMVITAFLIVWKKMRMS